MLALVLSLAALPGPELVIVGPARPGEPSTLAVRARPEAPLHAPAAPCATSTTSLAALLQAAFRENRPVDRHRLGIDPAALERALAAPVDECRSPRAALADRLDRAAEGALSAAAEHDPRQSALDARLARLRARPLAYAWAELSAPAAARREISAWAASDGDPARLLGWAARAGLVARSWSERTAPPEAERVWAWPWITLLLVAGCPAGLLVLLAPRWIGPAAAGAACGLGIAARLAGGDPRGLAAIAPSLLVFVFPLARGLGPRARGAAILAGLGLAALGFAGDGLALALAPLPFALAAGRRGRACPGPQ